MTEMSDRELLIRIDERVRSLERKFDKIEKKFADDFVKKETHQKVVDDVKWLKKFFWLTFSTGLGALATAGFLFIQFLANT